MSWHYLRDQEAGYSEDICLDGKPWRPAKSKITHERHYYGDNLTESYLNSLYGMISTHSMELSSGAVSISLQEDSLARTYPQPGRALESLANDLDCGRKCTGSLAKYDHYSHSWKTLQCSLLGDLEPYSETWPKSGTMRNGQCWERMTSERRTNGNESGSWPTPTKRDWKGANAAEGLTRKDGLSRMDQLPNAVKYHGGTKTRQIWGTPRASDGMKNTLRTVSEDQNCRARLEDQVAQQQGPGGQLNPSWVEWLMNWPCGWTSLEDLSNEHFEYWKKASAEGFQGSEEMRDMRRDGKPQSTSCGPQHNEQQPGEYQDSLSEVPREDSRRREMEWPRESEKLPTLREALPVQESQGEVLQPTLCESLGMGKAETVQRVATGVKNRADRLKAIGNGQVPATMATAFLMLLNRIEGTNE